jgi:pyruvate formate-lyase/glycerol dehydratase family glycyl radical enzyme
MSAITEAMTPQEIRIASRATDEPKPVSPTRRKTADKLERLRKTAPRFSIDRARLMTESFKRTTGEPRILRWAKALKHMAENIPIHIETDDLIVGRGCGYAGRWGLVYPELEQGALEMLAQSCLKGDADRYHLSAEDAAELIEDILPYWKGNSYFEAVMQALPKDTLQIATRNDNIYQWSGVLVPSEAARHSAQWALDYEKVLKKGFKGLRQDAEQRLTALDPLDWRTRLEKAPFLEAVIATCEAAVTLAKRYANLARLQSEHESDPQRRQELKEIADICEWVPENPARSFREAVQAQWFTQLISRLEQKTGGVVSNGRMDQYLYPFYIKDIRQGLIDESGAQEILEHLWLSMANYVEMYSGAAGSSFTEGYAHWETVTIGGKTRDGKDASNELSHLFLKSKRELPLNFPDLGARIHSQTPPRFLHDVCETIKEGTGTPKLINDEEVIPYYLSIGAKIEDANDYVVSGCAEGRLINQETYCRGVAFMNLGSAVEMTLNDGKIAIFDHERIGIATGDVRTFKSYDDFFQAFRRQLENLLTHMMTARHVSDALAPQYLAAPLASMLNDTCLQACMDLHTGNVPGGIHRSEFDYIGYATAIDSLMAVKKLVFDDQRLTMPELVDALRDNFEGHEAIRQLCLNAPKYGNNDPETNQIGRAVEQIGVEFCHRYPLYNGGRMHVRYIPITAHIAMGFIVGATPNGRKANTFLSEGSSPSQGANSEGISAVLLANAATKCNTYNERSARLLNVKLVPAAVAGEQGTRRLMSFVRSWLDLKLWHIQFNIINRKTLIAAQQNPEQYRDLIVRVAGYNAYFTDLSPDLQEEIIARADYEI